MKFCLTAVGFQKTMSNFLVESALRRVGSLALVGHVRASPSFVRSFVFIAIVVLITSSSYRTEINALMPSFCTLGS